MVCFMVRVDGFAPSRDRYAHIVRSRSASGTHIGNHIVTRTSYDDAAAGDRHRICRIGRGCLVTGGGLEAVGGLERRVDTFNSRLPVSHRNASKNYLSASNRVGGAAWSCATVLHFGMIAYSEIGHGGGRRNREWRPP